ncbi:hypothetical protein C1645_827453 [Glomus cerebriforme]|uniref:Wax synthase domain-containing protein n=1 Tax=Glomus cerebriforme TaxID=658196 RepID=A0A397SUR9_9GLOM|nr:hypothetical protein C1645_827453 [Glomus cerebriforme]
MFIWLKNSLNDPSSTKPFVWSLFHWRPKEGDIPTINQQDLLEQGIPRNQLTSFINIHYKRCFCFWLFYISCSQFTVLFAPKISDTPYPIRIIDFFFYDGPPFTTLFNLFYCYIYAGVLFFSMNYIYEVLIISSAHLLLYIYSSPNSLLHTILNKNQLNSLKLWLISFLFYTNPIFNQPYLSKNPRELWSIRWHQLFHEFFIEIGYKPTCYIFSFASIKLQKLFGTLAAFAISGILHEYILYSSNRYFTLEQMTYFLFNAIFMVIWESLWKEIKNSIFMTFFILLSLPWFIEPYIRCGHYNAFMHFISRKT